MSEPEWEPVDVFSPRWHEGYIIGRKGLGSGALHLAVERASASAGAVGMSGRIAEVRDGFAVGTEEAGLLPHRVTLRLATVADAPVADGTLELPMREFAGDASHGDGPGFYTGDTVSIAVEDLDGRTLAEAIGRVERADISAGRVSVYIERVDG